MSWYAQCSRKDDRSCQYGQLSALYDQLIVKGYKMVLTENKRARLENFLMKMVSSQLLPLTNVVL